MKLALVQNRISGGALSENLARAHGHIATARARGADVVLLPETLNLGWTHRSAHTAADAIPHGETCRLLCSAAIEHGVYVCAGAVERAGHDLFNAAVLIDPQGEVLLHHRKLNELDIAHHIYAQGDRLGVAHTPLGTFGLMICADAFVRGQTVARTLGLMGADVILSPCAWAVPAEHDNNHEPYGQLWLDNYGAVTRDFRLWIAGCSNVGWIDDGPWQGRKCIGCSLVVDANGQPALRGLYGPEAETILYVEIPRSPRPARGDAWEKLWTPQRST